MKTHKADGKVLTEEEYTEYRRKYRADWEKEKYESNPEHREQKLERKRDSYKNLDPDKKRQMLDSISEKRKTKLDSMTEEEKNGTIGKYTDKGFGFLENGLFFHIKEIPKEIHAFLESGLKVN